MKQVKGFKYILEFFGSDLIKNVFQIETANNVHFFILCLNVCCLYFLYWSASDHKTKLHDQITNNFTLTRSLEIVDALGFLTSTRYLNLPFPKSFWEASIKLYLSCHY